MPPTLSLRSTMLTPSAWSDLAQHLNFNLNQIGDAGLIALAVACGKGALARLTVRPCLKRAAAEPAALWDAALTTPVRVV